MNDPIGPGVSQDTGLPGSKPRRKIDSLLVISILLLIIAVLIHENPNIVGFVVLNPAGLSASTITYYLHTEADAQFGTFKRLLNSSPDAAAETATVSVGTGTLGLQCFAPNWTTANFTRQTFVNGTWNFTITGHCSAATPVANITAIIFKLNTTGGRSNFTTGTESTSMGTNLCAVTVPTNRSWLITAMPAGANVSKDERVGVQICVNVTNVQANQLANITFEGNSTSMITFTNASDYTPVSINFVNPTPANGSSVGRASIIINATVIDNNSEISACLLELDGVNQTMTKVGTGTNIACNSTLSIAVGIHNMKIYANDTENNMNASDQRTITVACGFVNSNLNVTSNLENNGTNCFDVNVSNILIGCQGFNITSNRTGNAYAFNNTGFNNVTMQDCNFYNFTFSAIMNNAGNTTLFNNTFVMFATGGQIMMTLTGTGGRHVIDMNSILSNFAGSGISVGVDDVNITRNYINNTNAFAANAVVTTGGRTRLNIMNNTLDNYFSAGVSLVAPGTTNSLVRDNLIRGNNAAGISLENSNNNIIFNNTIINSGNSANGALFVTGTSSNNTFSNNTVSNNAAPFINVGGTAGGNRFENNKLSNATNSVEAIRIARHFNNFTSNQIINVTAGIQISGGQNNTFTSNFISNNNTRFQFNITTSAKNNFILNQTYYNRSQILVNDSSFATIQWFVDVFTQDSGGNPISTADFNITDVSTFTVLNAITDSTGFNRSIIINQSVINSTTELNYTPHNFTAKKTGQTGNTSSVVVNRSQQVNITINGIITGCGTLTASTDLTADLQGNTSTSCLTFGANNIYLNCSGFRIKGNGSGVAVNSTGFTGVTVRNCIIDNYSVDINFNDANNSFIINNTLSNATKIGIIFSNNIDIENNTMTGSGTGIGLGNGLSALLNFTIKKNVIFSSDTTGLSTNLLSGSLVLNNTIYGTGIAFSFGGSNNSVINNTVTSNTGLGLYQGGSEKNNTFIGNDFSSNSSTGIEIDSTRNNLTNNVGRSNSGQGLSLVQGSHNSFSNNTWISNSSDAIRINLGNNNTFTNNTLISNNVGINFLTSSNNSFINNLMRANISWILTADTANYNNISGNVFETDNGKIRIFPTLTIPNSTNVSVSNLNTTSNNAYLNASNLSFLNTSAQITLNSITFTNPQPIVDFGDTGSFDGCPSNICQEISFANNIFVYNVTHFTSYSSSETGACGTLFSDTTLSSNQAATGTCYTISASNITLDCAGFNIVYANMTTGNAVKATSFSNITIKNCNISVGSATTNVNYGINFIGVNDSRILNNTITTNGVDQNSGVVLSSFSNRIKVENNTIRTNGSGGSNVGVLVQTNSSGVNVTGNIIFANGTTNNDGIYLNIGVSNSTVRKNNISTGGTSNFNSGIHLFSSSNNNIVADNVINTSGTDDDMGVFVDNSQNNVFANNTITAKGTTQFNYGFYLNGADKNNITNNTIRTFGSDVNIGIGIESVSKNNTATNNNITTGGTGVSNYGIELFDRSNNNIISGNWILTNGTTDNYGIYLTGTGTNTVSNNTVANNTVFTGGSSFGMGIALFITSNNNITNNTIITTGSSKNSGIWLQENALNDRFQLNNITINGSASYGVDIIRSNSTFFNLTIVTGGDWINSTVNAFNNFTNMTFVDVNGSINFLNFTVSGAQDIKRSKLNVSFNKAFLNSTNITFLNTSATISLFGIPFSNPTPTVDFADSGSFITCPTTICTKISFGSGILVFNVTRFTTYSSNVDCGDIGASATLTGNVTSNATCFNITTSNVVLDCAGFAIRYALSSIGQGVISTRTSNLTIKNCLITSMNSSLSSHIAVNFTGVNSSLLYNDTLIADGISNTKALLLRVNSNRNSIQNSTLNATNGITIYLNESNTNNFTGSVVFAQDSLAIYLERSTSNFIKNNTIKTNGTTFNIDGFRLTAQSSSNIMANNMITTDGGGNSRGFEIQNSNSSIIENNTILTQGAAGLNHAIDLSASSFTNASNNTIVTSGDSGFNLGISLSNSYNDMFSFNNITTKNASSYAIYIFNSNNSLFNATLIFEADSWMFSTANTFNNFTNLTLGTGNGSVKFINLSLNGAWDISQSRLNFTFNNVYLNSSYLTFMNTSATLVLFNLSFTDPRPTVDFEDDGSFVNCPASICTEISFTGGTFIFNVTQFTAYSSAETQLVTTCPMTINSSGFYNLNASLTSNGTCVHIAASNVSLDCLNYIITGNGTGIGINITNRNNITIVNCNIRAFTTGILMTSNHNSTYENNTLKNGTTGFSITIARHDLIKNNSVADYTTSGISFGTSGVNVNLTILNNYINNSGNPALGGSAEKTSIVGNSIMMSSVSLQGNDFNHGLMENNTIVMTANNQVGLRLLNGGVNNTIKNNSINMTSAGSSNNVGLSLGANSITNNTIVQNTMLGTSAPAAISIGGSTNSENKIENNTIRTTGTSGIDISSATKTKVVGNYIEGPSTFGIRLNVAALNTTLVNNSINLSGSTSSTTGILVDRSPVYDINLSDIKANISIDVRTTNGTDSVIYGNSLNGSLNFTTAENHTLVSNNLFNKPITLKTGSKNVTSLNMSNLNRTGITVSDTSSLVLQWYVNVQVMNFSSIVEKSVTVNVSNLTGGQLFFDSTDASGLTPTHILLEAVINSTGKFNVTPYLIIANKSADLTTRRNSSVTRSKTFLMFIGDKLSTGKDITPGILNPISIPLNLSNFTLGNESLTGIMLNITPTPCVQDIHFWNESEQFWYALTSYFTSFGWHSTTFRGDSKTIPWRGYYFRATQNCNLTVKGNASYDEVNVFLQSGWNLVGWFTPWRAALGNDSDIDNPFTLNESAYIEAWRRIGLGWEEAYRNTSDTGWTLVNSGSGAFFNETVPFEAYWIYVDRNVTWIAHVQ